MSDNINWNETAIYEFMRFEREPERRVFPDRDITKLAKAGLIQENETGDWTLTQTGEDELANIRQHFNSGKLSELPLKVRNYYFDWRVYDEKKLPVKELSKVALHDRSAEIRKKAATMLNKFSKLDKETSNGLAHDEDYQIRLMAAKNADPHLFFEESDERVVKTLIYNHNFDKECVEHWLDNPNSQIRVQAALLTEDGKVDEVLARLNPQDVAHVLADEPQWATCERVMNAWENADEVGRYRLVKVMRDMPDSFINQAFKGDAYMALHDRLEEYREAVRQVLELGFMFSEDSEIRRKIWERAEHEIG